MSSETTIELTCVHCQRRWQQDIIQLGLPDQVIYKGETRLEQYRVRCPNPECRQFFIITVSVEGG
jgi:hypothetical protein